MNGLPRRFITALRYVIPLFAMTTQWGLAFAENADTNNTQIHLNTVNSHIITLKKTLALTQTERQQLLKNLKYSESLIVSLTAKINQLNQRMAEKQTALAILKQEYFVLQEKQRVQKILLAQQLRASYQLGQNDYFQLFLNQQDPTEINRLFVYYQYIHKARLQTLNDIQKTQRAIENNQKIYSEQVADWKKLYQEDLQQKTALQYHLQSRKKIINQLDFKIETQASQLKEYEKNKIALENLIHQLKQAKKIIALGQQPYIPHVSLQKMQHHLQWPTQGKISTRYGGVIILAPAGQSVVAIYPGKVVFAHTLKGFGLLIIIDHGNGYMTLYADNQSIYCKAGDIVKANERIATVGQTGILQRDGLYFEIRHNGKPMNPLQWLAPGVNR